MARREQERGRGEADLLWLGQGRACVRKCRVGGRRPMVARHGVAQLPPPSVGQSPIRLPHPPFLGPAGALVYAVTMVTKRLDPAGEGWLPKDLDHVRGGKGRDALIQGWYGGWTLLLIAGWLPKGLDHGRAKGGELDCLCILQGSVCLADARGAANVCWHVAPFTLPSNHTTPTPRPCRAAWTCSSCRWRG